MGSVAPDPERTDPGELHRGLVRPLLRIAIALGLAGALVAVVWWRRPIGLDPPIDIVGYPTYANFDFHPGFLAYRLVVWVLPIAATVVLWLLWRRGPLASSRPQRRSMAAPVPASVPTSAPERAEPRWSPAMQTRGPMVSGYMNSTPCGVWRGPKT
ncbi:MAG TPA: hypothetical protein PK324_13855, partial [Nocardioides sp.]|nr:hypothetical protein [Nocardioides sp.]